MEHDFVIIKSIRRLLNRNISEGCRPGISIYVNKILAFLILTILLSTTVMAEPIVVCGKCFPSLLGKPVKDLRVCIEPERAIPFQVDEVTAEGEYICDSGKYANSGEGNGLLDSADEIVFLCEDCIPCRDTSALDSAFRRREGTVFYRLTIDTGNSCRAVYVIYDPSVSVSSVRYIYYNNSQQMLQTPWYYAQFGRERFHFVDAGIVDSDGKTTIKLTKELKIEIFLSALWGILPIRYSENNIICFVERYKCGPVRLIRRGDIHLRLGFGIKGSNAKLNQICYPEVVRVPVELNLPIRFKHFVREAWIEMCPVIDKAGGEFVFSIPDSPCRLRERIDGEIPFDSLIPCSPDRYNFTVMKSGTGIGWMLLTNLPKIFVNGSGFIFRRPSPRNGLAECGYRLVIHDIPRGRYDITNWVLFSQKSESEIGDMINKIINPAEIRIGSDISRNIFSKP